MDASLISVILWDVRLQRQTQEAHESYLSHADTAKSKEELEKAKQRELPKILNQKQTSAYCEPQQVST